LYRRAPDCYRAAVPSKLTGCLNMANIASQIKRNRQTVKRKARNQAVRSELKTRTKATMTAARSGESSRRIGLVLLTWM